MLGLLQWHFWYAPQWIAMFSVHLEQAAARYFSAPLMVRTLFAHWHKDAVSYQQRSLGNIALAFAWNMISRVIGFSIRSAVLVLYAAVAICIALMGVIALLTFLFWPVVLLAGLALVVFL